VNDAAALITTPRSIAPNDNYNKEVCMIRNTLTMVVILMLATVSSTVAAETASAGVVNVNTASAAELQLLPRIGPALAERIIEFRDTNGPFASVAELVAVKGIGESSLERLEPYVTTQGATTLSTKVKLPRSTDDGGAKAGR
jgi:competence protein ComEA